MLSRFSLTGAQSLRTCVLKWQPVSAITTSAVASESAVKTSNPLPPNVPPEYPPPTSKRDFVNFPRPIMLDTAPPVRLGFIPDSWFQFLYPKTGYTGPYVLCASVLTYLFSKEIIVIDHNIIQTFSFIGVIAFIHLKFGDKIGEAFNKVLHETIEKIDNSQEQEKEVIREGINFLENTLNEKKAVAEVTKATTEFVQMQMELVFRERLLDTFQKVKNKLDCQAELENVEKRIAQRNLMDYVLRNVMKSITPDLEKNIMQLCIKDLNALASRS